MTHAEPANEPAQDITFKPERQSLFIVLSGPGGTGKTTLIKRWRESAPDLSYVPNITTRKPRPASAVDESGFYEFVTPERFRELVEKNAFVQWVNPSKGKYYGTPIAPLHDAIARGQDVVFDYTPQLFINMRRIFRERTVGVFVIPPSLRDLAERLARRGTERGSDLKIKFQMGLQDLGYVEEHDYHVVNENIEETLEVLKSIRTAEHHRLARNASLLQRYAKIAPRTMLFYYDPLGLRVDSIAPTMVEYSI
jgi:guanylate kinase